MTDEPTSDVPKPKLTAATPEDRAAEHYHVFMGKKKGDVPLSVVQEHVVRKVAEEIKDGTAVDDVKDRAARAFATVDNNERKRANKQMRTGQASFDLEELDLIVALAGVEDVEYVDDDGTVTHGIEYSQKDTSRCRIGVVGMGEYLRWDFLQDANRKAANDAYDRGKARFRPYLPYFQQGLTVEAIRNRGLV